jgi:hypothetical protein
MRSIRGITKVGCFSMETQQGVLSSYAAAKDQGVPIGCFWSRITFDTRMIRDTLSIRSCDTYACASSEQEQQQQQDWPRFDL